MKKETIFKYEMNESIQADAAMNCLKNRNKHKQINEVAPVVAAAGRMLLPMLRPIITKLVQKALVKIGNHARPTQVIKLVMDMLSKGEFAKKMAEKCGQTWNEIPSEVKKEIQDAIIAAFKKQSPQEQEETSDFDARFEFRKDLRELASPIAKKAYMIIRKQYGDGMWRQLYMDDCDERGLIDMLNMYAEKGFNPQQIVNKMLGVREDEETVDYSQLADDVCASYCGRLSKMDLKDSIKFIIQMMIKKLGKNVSPQEMQEIQKAAKHSVWYVSEQEELTVEQEESADDKGAFALKLVKKFKNKMTPDYAKRPEMFMMLKLQKALKKPLMSLSKEEYRAWAKAICGACESVFGTQEQEEEDITPPLFDSEQERHDIALATAYCLGESFIDNDGDLDDIYYAVLKYFDSTYDAPETADYEDVLKWCKKHYKQIESMIN